MPTRFITHADDLHPHLQSRLGPTQLGFMRRAMRFSRLPKPLRQLGARGVYVPPPGPGARGAKVKVWQGQPSTTAAHLHYLQDGKGKDGADAEVFTAHGQAINQKAFAERVASDPRQWRMMVSLDDGDRVDLKAFTRAYMLQVEKDLGTRLDYAAAVHYDQPDRPHVHLAIAGVDDKGAPLYLTKEYLMHGLRYRAMTLGTERLGPIAERTIGPRDVTAPRTLTRTQVEARMLESAKHAQLIRERMSKGRGIER